MEKLKLQFSSLSDALMMDGHGIYVWVVYLVAALILIAFSIAIDFKLKMAKNSEQIFVIRF